MADVYEPSRGGVRGGHDQFTWDRVRVDKDRENYLGHSLKAPVGRSQGGPDFLWYNRESRYRKSESIKMDLKEEKQSMKKIEEEAMMKALGSSYSFVMKTGETPTGSTSSRFLFTPASQRKTASLPEKTYPQTPKIRERSKERNHRNRMPSTPRKCSKPVKTHRKRDRR